jgi:phage gp36-like protein
MRFALCVTERNIMAYTTITELSSAIPEDVLRRLTDDDSLGETDEEKLQTLINEAAGEIDSYLAGIYDLPLSPVPSILVKFNKDIAVYNAMGRYKNTIPETWSDRYKAAIRFLERVADGRQKLNIQPEPDPPDTASGSAAQVSTRTKDFSSTIMDKF